MSALSIISLGADTTPASVSPCQNYNHNFRVEWDTNILPVSYPINISIYSGTTSQVIKQINASDLTSVTNGVNRYDVTFEVFRWNQPSQAYAVAYNATSSQLTELYYTALGTFNILNTIINTDVNNLGTITVNTVQVSNSLPLLLEISINNVDWFTTNTLTGISPGDYTLYVRDAYGCVKTESFTILAQPSFEVYNDFSFISKLNPVPFTNINNKRPSINNVPSYLRNVDNIYKNLVYEYLNTETIRFQFQSNYEVNKAYLINCGEIVQELDVAKKSDNLNQRDIRDAKFYFEDGFLRAYYDGTGNVYDSDDNVIGQNELNGSLLFDQVEGEILSIKTLGLIEILEVISVDGIGQVMVLNYTTTVPESYLKITTYYNLENYEIYEFDLTMPATESNYQIVIVTNSTAQFDELNPLENATFISEVINPVTEFTKDKFKFVWKNSENNQIAWDTGIECFAYFDKVLEPVFEPQDENEIYTTDTTKFMLESEVYDVFVFHFDIMSQIQTRQMMLIASSDYLLIDDEFYVKEETPEVEALTGSNSYVVKLKVTLASNYNSNEREGLTTSQNVVNTDGFLRLQ